MCADVSFFLENNLLKLESEPSLPQSDSNDIFSCVSKAAIICCDKVAGSDQNYMES